MNTSTVDTEDYNDSIKKCSQINDVIPRVCKEIKQIQQLDSQFSHNHNLKVAEQLLDSLRSIYNTTSDSNKAAFVKQYRTCLISGLNNLGEFFTNFKQPEQLSEAQRSKFSLAARNIATTQKEIINIASH